MKKLIILLVIFSISACNTKAKEQETHESITSHDNMKGSSSPKFSNYENYNGGSTSLDDLKGKFVYLDVWATWCGPCRQEIPFLKEIEKEFHDKNIEFVSISVDDKEDYNIWKQMIAEEEMGGIQLYANGDNEFIDAYNIETIPRFILIDNYGNIINSDAPMPSDPVLKEVLNGILN